LRCSFHKTAKRLSITGLTHLLRLRSKIQSSIVRHLSSKSPTTKTTIWPSFCATLTGTNPSLLLTGLSYTICDFATNKTEMKKKRSITNPQKKTNTKSKFTDNTRLSNDDKTQKKSRIGLLHRNQFPEGIQLTRTIISQIYRKKKICLKKR